MHLDFRAVVDPRHRRALEQADAQRLGSGGFAEDQVERVQVARAHVHQAADVAIGADHAAHLRGRHQAHLVAIAEGLEFLHVLAEAPVVAGLVRQVAVAPAQIAVDGVLLDPATDDLHRLQAHQLECLHAVGADHREELLDVMADAADQLAAIASTGAPADPVRFQQDHGEAALGQFQRRVHSREAAADDAHVGLFFAGQGRALDASVERGGVVGGACWAVCTGW